MLPNFFIAGCQKGGTTSLHHYLIQHPGIYLPEQKETKHFVRDDRYKKGIYFYENTYFPKTSRQKAIGEVDPDYLYFEKALVRIKQHFDLPKLKFIFIFRNPVQRAFSHYLMTYRRGIETKSFANAIDLEHKRITNNFFHKSHFSYVERGFYHKQLLPFIDVLQPEQMLFLLTEDLKNHRETVLEKCFDFLGVNSEFSDITSSTNHHCATVPRSDFLLNEIVRKQDSLPKKVARLLIPNKTLRHRIRAKLLEANQTSDTKKITLQKREQLKLIELYQAENKKLATLLGRDLSHWDKPV